MITVIISQFTQIWLKLLSFFIFLYNNGHHNYIILGIRWRHKLFRSKAPNWKYTKWKTTYVHPRVWYEPRSVFKIILDNAFEKFSGLFYTCIFYSINVM